MTQLDNAKAQSTIKPGIETGDSMHEWALVPKHGELSLFTLFCHNRRQVAWGTCILRHHRIVSVSFNCLAARRLQIRGTLSVEAYLQWP